jgi:DNA repair exonuclease SbcCD nuclease subunit
MVRFIHTADWQLGLRVRYMPVEDGAIVRDARLRALRNIARLAETQAASFVVVAGDVFEHHGLKPATLEKTFDALRAFPCPVYLLPGNHDPLTPDSLYKSSRWTRGAPDNVHVLGNQEPVQVEGAWLLPCPLLERHTFSDPTDHLTPDFGPQGVIRLGVAHGGIREILEGMAAEIGVELANALRVDAAQAGQLDYLALGDWHSVLQIDDRTWYPGAHEATRFKERDPGQVLVVEIDAPGAIPKVTPHRVAELTWVKHAAQVSDLDDLAALEAWFDSLEDRANTLVEVAIAGTVDAATDAALRQMLDRQRARLRWLRLRGERLEVLMSEEDLDHIASQGWLKEVVDALKPRAVHDDTARRALHLLYRLHVEVNP